MSAGSGSDTAGERILPVSTLEIPVSRLPMIVLVALLPLAACSSSADSGEAAAAAAAEAAEKKVEGRSYDNPDSALTSGERADILALCTAVAGCDRKRCSAAQDKQAFTAIQTQSKWGKLMKKHLIQEGRTKGGKRLARLLVTEDLKWASKDCRAVVKVHAHKYQ